MGQQGNIPRSALLVLGIRVSDRDQCAGVVSVALLPPQGGFSGHQDGCAGMAIGRAGLVERAVPAGSWGWLMGVPSLNRWEMFVLFLAGIFVLQPGLSCVDCRDCGGESSDITSVSPLV